MFRCFSRDVPKCQHSGTSASIFMISGPNPRNQENGFFCNTDTGVDPNVPIGSTDTMHDREEQAAGRLPIRTGRGKIEWIRGHGGTGKALRPGNGAGSAVRRAAYCRDFRRSKDGYRPGHRAAQRAGQSCRKGAAGGHGPGPRGA